MSLLKSVTTIAGSSVISQLIGAGSIWFISHKYGMAEVGTYALIYSIVLIGAQVCLFASQLLLPKQSSERLNQNVAFCILQSAVIAIPFSYIGAKWFDLAYYFVYLLTLAHALILVSENLLLRDEKVRGLALQRLSVSVLVITSLLVSDNATQFYWSWAIALIGLIVLWLFYSVKLSEFSFNQFGLRENYRFFKENKGHISRVGSAEVLAMANNNLPTILVNFWFSALTAGYFAVVSRFCLSPVFIVGNAVRNSIFSRWSQDFRNDFFNYPEYKKTRRLLLALGSAAVLGVFIFYPIVMDMFFSEEWQSSVPTSRYMLPYLFIALAISPLTVVELIFGDPKYFLRIQVEQLLIVLIAFVALPYIHNDYAASIITYASLSFVRYLFIFIRMNKQAKKLAVEKTC